MCMYAKPIGLCSGFLVDVVPAVPHERPGHPVAHHDSAVILAGRITIAVTVQR